MTILCHDGTELPDEGTYYVVAGNGMFLRKRNNWVDATVPVDEVDGLKPLTPAARILLPKITSTVFAKALLFMHSVYVRSKVESAVLLHYSRKHGWACTVPDQEATAQKVRYRADERIPGYRCVGTIHSHARMSAFHSSTDVHDELTHDGIHITVGKLNHFPEFDFDAECVVNGSRFPILDGHVMRLRPVMEVSSVTKTHYPNRNAQRVCTRKGTMHVMPLGILRDWQVPEQWMARVKMPVSPVHMYANLRKHLGPKQEAALPLWPTDDKE